MEQWLYHFGRFYTFYLDYNFIFELICASLGAVLVLGRKDLRNKKNLIFMSISFISLFVIMLLLTSISSSIANTIETIVTPSSATQLTPTMIIFTLLIVGALYIFIFTKHNHFTIRIFKMILYISSTYVCTELVHCINMAFLYSGAYTNSILINFLRNLAELLIPLVGLLTWKFPIEKYHKLPTSGMVFSLIAYLFLFIVTFLISTISAQTSYIWIILLFILIAFFLIVNGIYVFMYQNLQNQNRELELQAQIKINDASYTMLKLNEESIKRTTTLRHDLKNHYTYMQMLLEERKYEEMKNYLTSLNDDIYGKVHIIDCGNMVISSIMNLELTKANINDVELKYLLVVPETLPYKETDLCSIITNTIDNALEASKQIKDGYVDVKMFIAQEYFRIRVSNKTDLTTVPSFSTKKEVGHGYGMKIVKEIAKKYEGFVSYSIENGLFIADIMLLLENEENKDATNSNDR